MARKANDYIMLRCTTEYKEETKAKAAGLGFTNTSEFLRFLIAHAETIIAKAQSSQKNTSTNVPGAQVDDRES